MVWLAVDKDGTEKIFDVKPFRGNTQKDRDHVWGWYIRLRKLQKVVS